MKRGQWRLEQTRRRLLLGIRELPNGCWEWTRFTNPEGYGTTSYYGRRGTPAHRAMYMELIGPIPEGMTLDHLCHSNDSTCMAGKQCVHRRCVNPAHLEPVTTEVNASRQSSKRKTHCPYGHPYTGENLIFNSIGGRACRECARRRGRDRLARLRAAEEQNTSAQEAAA
jgi:hypothetical protein